MNDISYEDFFTAWKRVKKTCKNKIAVGNFDLFRCRCVYRVYESILNGTYNPRSFRLFVIFEPKVRLVMSHSISDKMVNHFVTNKYLIPLLDKKLIDTNVATRKCKGSAYADKLLRNYINDLRSKSKDDIYVLKIDVSKYFYTINHEILINKLNRDIKDKKVVSLIEKIINETDKPYINETIKDKNYKYNINLPYYEKGVGLSIGAVTSQFLAIYYLSDLDHFIKEKLNAKYYIRYMDDMIILDNSKDRLKEIKEIIGSELKKLKLKMNPKSEIINLKNGLSFLGYRYYNLKKIVVKYNGNTYRKVIKKLNILKKYNIEKYCLSYASYYGYLSKIRFVRRDFKMKSIEKYNEYKIKYPYYIIFIKEGKFYRTFDNDAIIIWSFYKYKWMDNSICFGNNACNKIFNDLKDNSLGFVIIDEDNSVIKGNEEMYNLFIKISKIKYEKYLYREKIVKLIDEVISNDEEKNEKLVLYLEGLKNN